MKTNNKIEKAHRNLLMFGMFSVIMLFAGLTSAYIVSKGALGSKWDIIILPNMFYISTIMISISSLFGFFAIKYCRLNNFRMIKQSLLVTMCFGFLFAICQLFGWNALVLEGKFLSGNNVAASYLYILTIAHLLHLVGGLIAIIVVTFRANKNKYTSQNYNGLKLAIRFWHFLAILWIYLVLFLVLIN
ncbi:MAG: cytochrome oxidase subunit III [Flavobacteriales bacterium]|jgi:cytochrome c oxidase subunit 3|nr:cytochrome oxidase subunit III [Flavobacteriales bacterium]|tara:strand:+ start:201 stop:764 length:564 start_codon:yes stop_codon:yes gene_type:complete